MPHKASRNLFGRSSAAPTVPSPAGSSIASFTVWDVITPPGSIDSITVAKLQAYLRSTYRCRVQSVSWNDNMIFADYLADSDSRLDMSIGDLVRKSLSDSGGKLT